MKHTTAPWLVMPKLSGSENHRGFNILNADGDWALAFVQPGDSDGDEGRANAHLIAAAPELADAAEQIMAADSAIAQGAQGADRYWDEAMAVLATALAKARGDS